MLSEYFEESVRLSRQTGEERDLAEALTYAGITKGFAGDTEAGYPAAKEGLALAGELADPVLLGWGSVNMASVIAMMGNDLQEAKAYTDEGIRLLHEAGANWAAAMALMGIGIFATRQGDFAEARSRFEACIPLFENLGDRHRLNMVYSQIAHLERYQGQYEQAQSHYRQTLQEWQKLGHRAAIAHELECLAFIAKVREDDRRAGLLLGAAEILREKIGIPMTPVERPEYERELADLRRNVDEVAFARAWAEGRTLTMEQAIALAMESP